MNQYVTGSLIRILRESQKMTQAELAAKLMLSDKTISKWETNRGYPDVSLLEPLSAALHVSVSELLDGQSITNRNRSFQMQRSQIYVCPVCGNVLFSCGDAYISCCGVHLLPLEAEEPDSEHQMQISTIEDEIYVCLKHEMSKQHHISFLAVVGDNNIQLTKLYPEGSCEAYFPRRRVQRIFAYCNHHGLFQYKLH